MQRFDVHAHFALDSGHSADTELIASLMRQESFAGGGPPVAWSPESAIEFMDARDIAMQLLSLPVALPAEALRLSNQQVAHIVAEHPRRFGALASLPMIEPERAVNEIRHAVAELGVDGFILLSNYEGNYLGNELFEPVFAELDRQHASVFVHPTSPASFSELGLGRPGPLIEYPMDTARTVVDAVFAGLLLRHPNIKFVLAHAGGVLPALFSRILYLGSQDWVDNPHRLDRDDLEQQLGLLYLDTAIAGTPACIEPALYMCGAEHLAFGTDYTPAGLDVIDQTISDLHNTLDAQQQRQLETTFRILFPAAAARADAPTHF